MSRPVDRRLLDAGLAVTISDLVAVYIDHRPGDAPACGRCRHRYTAAAPVCPSRAPAADLLKRRQHENRDAVATIAKELTAHDTRTLPPANPPTPAETDELFGVEPARRKPKPTRRQSRPAA